MTTNVWLNQVTNPQRNGSRKPQMQLLSLHQMIVLLVLVRTLPSLLYNSSLRSGLIIGWLGSPLTMKE